MLTKGTLPSVLRALETSFTIAETIIAVDDVVRGKTYTLQASQLLFPLWECAFRNQPFNPVASNFLVLLSIYVYVP